MNTSGISFNRIASVYDHSRGFPPGVTDQITRTLLSVYPELSGCRLLDIGVGTGRLAVPLSAYTSHLVGIDISRRMLSELRRKETSGRLLRIQADATYMPFHHGVFDAALAVSVLHLIQNWHKALDEIERLVGGLFLLGRTEYCGSAGELYELLRHRLFRKYYPLAREPGLKFDAQLSELQRRWGAPEVTVCATWTKTFSPHEVLQGFEQRLWSETWYVSSVELTRLIDRMRQWVIDQGVQMENSISCETHFLVYAYRLCGTPHHLNSDS